MSDDDSFFLSKSKIAIVGLGLMGGSLALGLRGKCAALFGIDPHPATLELALSQNIVDRADSDPAKLLSEADLVILSAPVPAILTLLEQLATFTPNPCIVLDLGSTKRLIVEAMSRLPERFDPIGGHPICGKEKLSLANAERTLYYAAPFLLTALERTTPRALSAAMQIIEAVGAKAIILDAVEHDRILASTSHLPFLLSSALALATPDDVAAFVGPGFKSTSRLAGTSSSMMMGVIQSNQENVLNALHELQNELCQIESVLALEDFPKLECILNEAQTKYQEFIHPSSFMRIFPITHPLNATVRVPGSKSLTNRALLIASLANGTTHLTNALFSDDSRYFAKALQTLGFDIQLNEANHEMIVTGLGGKIPANKAELFIGNAGTAARFLSAFLTLGNGEYILDGDPRMRERPIGDLVDALTQLGAKLETTNNCPPVKITASGLPGGKTKIAGNISSQFLSALLMVAPYAKSLVEIEVIAELNSKPYVDMTIAIMKDFGVEIERRDYSQFAIHPAHYSPLSTYQIESDASAASYFFAAPAICGGTVRVENISRKSKQGDIAFLDVLEQMGCQVTEGEDFIEVSGAESLLGVDIDMRDIPDTAQTLAAIAPFANSPTRIRGIASARVKETDRVHATCVELARLGVQVDEHEDGMTIYPCQIFKPANIQTYNDHRMAMAFSLIGLRFNGVTIENPSCVSKTFPNFFDVLDSLR